MREILRYHEGGISSIVYPLRDPYSGRSKVAGRPDRPHSADHRSRPGRTTLCETADQQQMRCLVTRYDVPALALPVEPRILHTRPSLCASATADKTNRSIGTLSLRKLCLTRRETPMRRLLDCILLGGLRSVLCCMPATPLPNLCPPFRLFGLAKWSASGLQRAIKLGILFKPGGNCCAVQFVIPSGPVNHEYLPRHMGHL